MPVSLGPRPVVMVAPRPPPFLLDGRDGCSPRLLEVECQHAGAERLSHQGRDGSQHLLVPGVPTTSVRAGPAVSASLGLMNIPFLFPTIDGRVSAPPLNLLLVNAAIGMVSVVCASLAGNTGNRRAIRLNAAALIVDALMVVPGFFADTTPLITVISAFIVAATAVAVVLTMRREATPARVAD